MNHEFYVDNQLYLNFLEIDEKDLPNKDGTLNKQEFTKLVEARFRKLARKYHPEYGGNENDFKFLLNCKDKLINQKYLEKNMKLGFDGTKFLSFDKNTLASKLGNQLFDLLSEWKEELNINTLFRPTTEDDEYEWVFKILNTDLELCLNVQNLSNDLIELSNELYSDDSISVLVCLFVPSKQLNVNKVEYDDSVMLTFNDKILIEASNSKDLLNYFSSPNNTKQDLEKIISGNFTSRSNNVLKTKKSKEVIDNDLKVIEYLQNLKIFNTEYNESAADFLNDL